MHDCTKSIRVKSLLVIWLKIIEYYLTQFIEKENAWDFPLNFKKATKSFDWKKLNSTTVPFKIVGHEFLVYTHFNITINFFQTRFVKLKKKTSSCRYCFQIICKSKRRLVILREIPWRVISIIRPNGELRSWKTTNRDIS